MIQGGALDNTQEGDRGHTDAEVDQIVADAGAVLPALQGVKVQEVRRGRRPIPRDGEPIIGFSPTVSNLYLATTHSGVTLTPIIGEFAAIEIAAGAPIDLLATLSPRALPLDRHAMGWPDGAAGHNPARQTALA